MANSYKINDARTKVSRILEEEYKTTGTGGYQVCYQIGANSAKHTPTTALFKEGSLTQIDVDKYKATEINGTVRYFYVTPECVNVDSAYRRFTESSSSKSSSSSSSKSKQKSSKSKGSSSDSLVVGAAKWLFSETDKDKARRAEEQKVDEQISSMINPIVEKYKESISKEYPLDSDDAKTILGRIMALHAVLAAHKNEQVSGDDIESKAEIRLLQRKRTIEGNQLKRLIKHLNKKTNLKQIKKDAKNYGDMTSVEVLIMMGKVFACGLIIILLLLQCAKQF